MKLSQAFSMALKALNSNKMRSFLTMLGIIIGVFAVTVLISVGQGTSAEVSNTISSLGSNMLQVNVTSQRPTYLTLESLNSMCGQDGIQYIAPSITRSTTLKNGTKNMNTNVEGTTPEFSIVRNHKVVEGRFLTDSDLVTRSAVAVVGSEVANELYGTTDVIGQTLSVAGRKFRIVGLLETKGESLLNEDKRVLIPFSTAQRMFKQKEITSFYVTATSESQVSQAQAALERMLNYRTKDDDAYSVFNQASLLDAMNNITGMMTVLLGSLAGISLVVGGIGIMNIMLVSVTERTREIGIRKAIGAQRSNILWQFLIEALVLSLIGGIIGLGLGSLGIVIVSNLMGAPMTLSPLVALLAMGFSTVVGIGFGLYPANKASKLKPIDALRYE